MTRRGLFAPIEPFNKGRLKVSPLHTLYYEECGNPRGKPVVFLHGGPGGGIEPKHRRYFDPRRWRVVLFDQRGCGRSTPHAELRENTTWDLVSDIERLRERCGVERWTVFGGSWGSALALAYGQAHPSRCAGFILRGIFLLRRRELDWFYQEGGTSRLFPEAWESFVRPIPPRERGDMIRAYYKRLTSRDRGVRLAAAKAWSVWEATTVKLLPDPELVAFSAGSRFAEAFARIECHYFIHKGFLKKDGQLLEGARRLRHLPCAIVQGRYDAVCPASSAWDLHKAWPGSRLTVVPDAGHSMSEPGIRSALLAETQRMARL